MPPKRKAFSSTSSVEEVLPKIPTSDLDVALFRVDQDDIPFNPKWINKMPKAHRSGYAPTDWYVVQVGQIRQGAVVWRDDCFYAGQLVSIKTEAGDVVMITSLMSESERVRFTWSDVECEFVIREKGLMPRRYARMCKIRETTARTGAEALVTELESRVRMRDMLYDLKCNLLAAISQKSRTVGFHFPETDPQALESARSRLEHIKDEVKKLCS